jgi:MSHA biogenesis protein MshG
MPRFAFNAKSKDGEMVSGFRQGSSAGGVAQELNASGLLPLKIELADEEAKQAAPAATSIRLLPQRVNINELVIFSHQMTSLMRAGISVTRAVRSLAESNKNELLRDVLLDVAGNLEGGLDFASCLGRHPKVFSALYVSLIHVGENTGRLDEAFRQIAQYLELERETKRRMQAATRYPMFVMIAIGIAIVVLNLFVIPAFADVFAKYSAELPWQTKLILTVSKSFVDYWHFFFGLVVVAIYAWRRFLAHEDGRCWWDRWKLKMPIIGSILERIYLSRFCHTFAMVSSAGVPITHGMQIVSTAIGNEFMARKISEMRANLERGEGIAQTAKSSELFSPVVLQMMAVGEETGAMDELLEQAATFYEEEVEYELKGLTDALEPILIIGIAGLVLVMALGVFLPLWDLNSVVN